MAKQANGSVTIQQGGTVVLVAAVASQTPSERAWDMVPLMVEYKEKTSAAGRIPGGFFKREGRPTEKEILTARLIDRPLRPLFPAGYANEVQIAAFVLSADGEYDPDVLALVGASAALTISDIPFLDSVGAVRVGRVNNVLILNPTYAQTTESTLDLVVAATRKGIIMIEAGAKEVPEQVLLEAIAFAQPHLLTLIEAQEELAKQTGKPKAAWISTAPPERLVQAIRTASAKRLDEINRIAEKHERQHAIDALVTELIAQYTAQEPPVLDKQMKLALAIVEQESVRRMIIDQRHRTDGRAFNEIRPITCEVGLLPRTHGSALFTRGQTQSLGIATLGTSKDEQLVEGLEAEAYKSFMLHYNFPPFSVGEVKPMRGPGRREIGHGALAERAIQPVIPTKEEFPYTIRIVSDILESNGSSSMASVCSGTLALMDAGVPIKKPVSGIAMGLVTDGKQTAILTDIAGVEDHYGDMDFKVAGTKDGVTALQLDVKLPTGISQRTIAEGLEQALPARLAILEQMMAAIAQPRAELSAYAPRIVTIKINPDKIRDVIGSGGKVIRKITETTGCQIDIEDDGRISIASSDGAAAQKAIDIIKSLTDDVEVGKIYQGKVKRLMSFGAFVEIAPGKEGLVRIGELSEQFVKTIEEAVKVGDEFKVKVIEVDEQGRINLSRKRAL